MSATPIVRAHPHLICVKILLLWAFAACISASFSDTCYYSANDSVFRSPNFLTPCGTASETSGTLNCCNTRANNICTSHSICYNPNTEGGSYYLSPCTDPAYSAPQCPQYCSEYSLGSYPYHCDASEYFMVLQHTKRVPIKIFPL